jgi:hypothetical protein
MLKSIRKHDEPPPMPPPRVGAVHSPHHRHRTAAPRATEEERVFLATSKVEDSTVG